MKRIVIWIIILAVVAGGVFGFLRYRKMQIAAQNAAQDVIRTMQITRGDLTINVPASGNVVAAARADLSFNVPGIIASVTADVSDRVTAGQELARLDTEDLESAIQQAQFALEQAQINLALLNETASTADIELAELAIQSASQSLKVARLSKNAAEVQGSQSIRMARDAADKTEEAYENYLDFLDKYGLPTAYAASINAAYMEAEGNAGITQVKAEYQIQQAQSQWLAANQALQQAKLNLERLQDGPDDDQIRQVELQIEQARINLEQAQARLDDVTITAPFDGIIATVNIQTGQYATSGRTAITLLDDTSFFVDVTVDEIDIGAIAEGQDVVITVDAYPDITLSGVVQRIAAVPSNAGGIIAYPVRIQIVDTAGADVRDGMTASAFIHTSTINDVLLVPNWAIRTDQQTNETYVYRMQDGVPVRTTVTLGARSDTQTVVTAGLEAGATVALVTEATNLFELGGPSRMRR